MNDVLQALARLAGIAETYTDVTGQRREITEDSARAVLAALGLPADTGARAEETLRAEQARRDGRAYPPYVIAETGRPPPLVPRAPWSLVLEDGAEREGHGPLPALPLGRHRLNVEGHCVWILSAPGRLPLPPRGWGVTLPLYGLRGPKRGGLGTYGDLSVAAQGLARVGASFVGVNPVHAGLSSPGGPVSPYSPSHRRMLAVAHVAPSDEPPAMDGAGLIDYTAALAARFAALEADFAAFSDTDGAFAAFRRESGAQLERFAIYEALSEVHGPSWTRWPAELRDAGSSAVRTAAQDLADRVRYHAWLQFMADRQLARAGDTARAAGMSLGLYLDLAVGTHPEGAETWADPASFAKGVSLGAPPDAFARDGQNWNLAPFNPRTLESTGFDALAATLRAQLRYAGMLRVDHILGFERAFWVPDGAPGAYVTMPRDAMLAVTRIEAARAGAVIVGEDLGNIPEGLTGALETSGILGCSVAQFAPETGGDVGRAAVLASFGTHDLPTWLGWRSGTDLKARVDAGQMSGESATEAWSDRKKDVARHDAALGCVQPVVDDMHAALGASSAQLVALQIEDILEVAEQPNLPGTTDEYPNWRRRLPVDAGELGDDARVARAAAILNGGERRI